MSKYIVMIEIDIPGVRINKKEDRKMYYVYSRHIDSGREDYCGCYNTMKEAVAKVRQCYNIDVWCAAKDEYYYFIKKH